MTSNSRRGAAALVSTLTLGLIPSFVPAQASAATTSPAAVTSTGAIFNNLSLTTVLNSPVDSSEQSDDIVVNRGDRLYLGSSSDPTKLSGWRTMSNGTRTPFGPSDYTLKSTGDHAYTMTFKSSTLSINIVTTSNVPSMYLRTHDGKSLPYVEAKKGNEDDGGSMALVNPDGSIVYNGALSAFKGHGNSTWDYPKKPYQIKLDKSTELVPGAGKGKTWILLADYLDPSLIRDEFAYNLEGAVLQRAGVSDDSIKGRMVDLYIDGNYRGAYYLTEKVQVDKNRINITDTDQANEDANPGTDLDSAASVKISKNDPRFSRLKEGAYVNVPTTPANIENDGYLLEMDFIERARLERSYFVTSHDTAMTLEDPGNASAAELSFVANHIQDFEDALYSVDGKNAQGKSWMDYIDLDSFARYYALQEVYMNEDAFKSSTYFHMDKGGKLIATPVWDCDRCDGNLNHGASVTSIHVGSWSRSMPSWIKQLEQHSEFRAAVAQAYNTYVGPEANTALNSKIPAYASEVAYSAKMDRLRWPDVGKAVPTQPTPAGDVSALETALKARLSALGKIFGSSGYLQNAPLADGVYTITNGKLVADVAAGSSANGAAVQLYSSTATDAQRFRITRGVGDYYSIINVKSGKALDVVGGKGVAGAKVVQNTPNGSDGQKWLIGTTDGTSFSVVSALSVPRNAVNYVLTATGNGTKAGTTLEIQTDTGASGQLFGFSAKALDPTSPPSNPTNPTNPSTPSGPATPVAGKTYTIVSALNKNMVLDVAGASSANKTNIVLYTANGSKAQQFTVTAGPNGTYILKTGPGGVVDVAAAGKTSGTNVDQYAANGTAAQQWILKPTGDGDGSFYIVSKLSGLNLDVKNSSTTNNTNIQTYTPNGTSAQKFYFYAK